VGKTEAAALVRSGMPLYAQGVRHPVTAERSPTAALLLGLVITLVAVVAYTGYITVQISGLRELQRDLTDRNRRDSLQLLRIQNDLNLLGIAMRDMVDKTQPYPLSAWSPEFQRIQQDLNDALGIEERLSVAHRTPEQRQFLKDSLAQFWVASDKTFSLAAEDKEAQARKQIGDALQPRQAALSTAVARLLVANNEAEQQAGERITQIYDRVERQVYWFLLAILLAIILTSLYLIRSNRRLFRQLSTLSEQRSELAQKLIDTQESTLLHISRELHDEFGQILTAMGSMLRRAGRHAPEGSSLRDDLQEVSEVAQSALDSVRSLSQALHPVTLEEAGLESTVDWYLPVVERQNGIVIHYEKSGTPFPLESRMAVHVYRVLQEALNNATRHSGTKEVWVRLRFLPDELELEVEDRGAGFHPDGKRGIGLVAMRERAELLGGAINFAQPPKGGTLVRLSVPRQEVELHA
jgi:signal transduction histidine kinase